MSWQSDLGVRVKAPGKINLSLAVGELDDDGYHEVATVYHAVGLWENVTARLDDGFTIEVDGTVDLSRVPTDAGNLALRAAMALARHTGYRGGVNLAVHKEVPVTGGMGGGSADAAAALVACDVLWGTGCSREELAEIAGDLGADVPFALVGGTAIGTGRGERVSPVLATGQFSWVLVEGPGGLSTPQVYGELDRQREGEGLDIRPAIPAPTVPADLLHALRAGDPHRLAEALSNDLQAPALELMPSLGDVLAAGVTAGALAGLVSGSGPTVAFLASDRDTAGDLAARLSATGLITHAVSGPVPGARVCDGIARG